VNLDDLQIIAAYGAEYRGIIQYYLLAGNVFRLHRLRRAAETSMLKTLAARHRSTVAKMARRYKATIATPHGPRTCFEARLERPGRKPLAARFGGIPLKRHSKAVITDRQPAPPARPKEIITRLLHGECEWCGRPARVETHQAPKARRPRNTRPRAARLGGPDGENAAQDPHRLRTLPPGHPQREASRELHVKKSLESRPRRKAPIRFGPGAAGKGPEPRAPRRRPTGVAQISPDGDRRLQTR
jgi:hypothetical protein